MNTLIVYAHPEPHSFNAALKDAAVATLQAAGHHVVVSDLYAMGFAPSAGRADFRGERADSDTLSISREQKHAYQTGALALDILGSVHNTFAVHAGAAERAGWTKIGFYT